MKNQRNGKQNRESNENSKPSLEKTSKVDNLLTAIRKNKEKTFFTNIKIESFFRHQIMLILWTNLCQLIKNAWWSKF